MTIKIASLVILVLVLLYNKSDNVIYIMYTVHKMTSYPSHSVPENRETGRCCLHTPGNPEEEEEEHEQEEEEEEEEEGGGGGG